MPEILTWAIDQQAVAAAELKRALDKLGKTKLTDALDTLSALEAMRQAQVVAYWRGQFEAWNAVEAKIRETL